jgi:hypothetical protein
MSRAMPPDAPLPHWPALMTTELACAYTSLARGSFMLLAGKHGVHPVECAGLAVVRWRRADLDGLIDKLPARGAEIAPEGQPANDPAEEALRRAQRRVRH